MSSPRIPIALAIMMLVLLLPGRARAQVGTVVATPSPRPSPLPTPRPATISRSFHCNCTSAGRPVLWAGNVMATNYFQARQLASSLCLAYIGEKPVSPLIPTPAVSFGGPPTFAPLGVNPCGQCACN
jgi:hypothetical protein